jgi:UDP-N-acetylmuramate dehydrogenase
VPGTIGGAVYGNAGAFGGDIAHDLISADVLEQHAGRSTWPVEKFEYGYRTSVLKHTDKRVIILSALIRLNNSLRESVQSKMDEYTQTRKRTQPPGASMGSMFKNPVGDYAGRLIEAAGLKGTRIGSAEISTVHGNFFINTGDTRARDIKALIDLARNTVAQKFNVNLELEVELIGDWHE